MDQGMSQTSTRFINFQTLESRGPSAATVIKLMMACNDMSLANQSLTYWKGKQSGSNKSRKTGAGMYFIRTQLAHLYEGLKIISEIQADPLLLRLLDRCDSKTRQSYQNLLPFIKGGAKRPELEQLIGKVRHNLTFHYDHSGKMIEKAIADRASRSEARQSSITRASTAHQWHFQVADDLVDSIVVRQIWKIPRDKDVRIEADKIAARVHQIFLWYVDFAGEFIWNYAKT